MAPFPALQHHKQPALLRCPGDVEGLLRAALSGKQHGHRPQHASLNLMASGDVFGRMKRAQETPTTAQARWSWPSLAWLCMVTLSFWSGGTLAMRLTSSVPQTLHLAQGEQATVGCTYTPDPEDVGDLDIEWSLVSPDTTKIDQLIISYSGGSKYFHGDPALKEGVDFAAGDPSRGDASLSIRSVDAAHVGTYQCKVKKSPGVDMRKVSLVVLERPSKPRCWVDGEEAVGEAVSLRCKSDQGSGPLQYEWKRESGGPIPPTVTQDPVLGELVISNHSVDLAGIYSCDVTNAVGKERCRLNLQAIKLFRWERKRYEKELSNEISEDVPAPESRPTSCVSSLHSKVAYSQLGQTQNHKPSSTSTAKYDSRYGYVV
ncbi:V-set and immunoglobulin domain-containing protein 8a isoform X2 [Hoplias malabaricus]|uniref:V-set and immunoglobulin domain-containing protein 8a isoform X2 n=1 Tax=Hoplias malabaricus TaxID=27720 RepID=UPI0034629602